MKLELVERIIELRKQGLSSSFISEDTGYSSSAVLRAVKFLSFHGEFILRELPGLVLSRKVSDYEFACIVEWAMQNEWACETTAFLFMVSRKQLAPWYKKRVSAGQPLLGAEPANPPKWASLTGENDVALGKKDIPTLEDLQSYKEELGLNRQYDSADIIACSYDDEHEEQPQKQEPRIGKARAEVKTTRPEKKMRRKELTAQKRQERALANQRQNLEAIDCPNKQAEKKQSIEPKPLSRGMSADQAMERAVNKGKGRPNKIDPNSTNFRDLPAEARIRALEQRNLELEAEVIALKKSIASIKF